MIDTVIFTLSMAGTIAFAVSGAFVAMEQKMDLLGTTFLSIITAVGGGIIRDVVLGHTPPAAFLDPIYLVTAAIVSLVAFLPAVRRMYQHQKPVFDKVLQIMDAVGLGVFTVVGMDAAYECHPNVFLYVFVGVVTGVGGGVLRDVMAGQTPGIFVRSFYASASIIGALLAVPLWRLIGRAGAMTAGAILIFVLRMLAIQYRWELPKA